jgi:peptidyl-prolyl cis-trans isomerase SurA
LDKRAARGKIKVAHIYLKKSEKPEVAEKQIQEAYKQIMSKKITFENAVKKYTEDASTKETYGVLNEFGVSEMVNDFEEQCFALKNPGDLSKPFMTEYGWHLVKLIEKIPVKGYEDSKDYIKQRMANDPRVNNLKGIAYSRMLDKYKFTEPPANLSPLMANMPDTFFMIKNWVLKPMKATESNTLFSFAGKSFNLKDFSNYVNTNYNTASSKSKKDAIDAMYAAYKEKVIWQMAKELLSAEDKTYSQLESEYMNGLLIFEIMDREVWKKALADTLGSMKMYEEVKSNYWFKDRVMLEGIKTKKTEGLDTYVQSLTSLSAKVVFEKIKQSKDSNEFVYYERTIERGDYPEIDKAMDAKAISVQFKDEDKSSILAKVVKLLPPSIKPYSEIKGRIQNLYQNKLEKEWGRSLRSKYPVKINNIELSKIIKKQ